MKKTFILLLLIGACMPVFSQNNSYLVKGVVSDQNSNIPIPNVNISVVGQNEGATTDQNGFFEIKVAKLPVQLFFSHLGYKIHLEQVENESSLKVFLEQEIEEIDEVVVSAKRIQKISLGDTLNVLDYELKGDRLILVATPYKVLHEKRLYLTDLEGTQLDFKPLQQSGKEIKFPENMKPEILHLHNNFMGGVNLLTKDLVWEVLADKDSISLRYPMGYFDFLKYLFPVKAKLGNSMYYQVSSYTENHTFRLSGDLDQPQEIKLVVDPFGGGRYMAPGHKKFYKYVSAPLFVHQNKVMIFDYFDNHIEFLDDVGERVDSVPMHFQNKEVNNFLRKPFMDLDQKNFTQKIIYDSVKAKAYALYNLNKNGRQSLREIDLKSGEIIRVIEIPDFPNIQKVRVVNNMIYFMYQVKTYPYYNSLYKMRI